ncbi:TetR/AcrR family transcriptional regulator [Mycobacterium sp. AT1]|uniref:TetR/AcrR family transcriptional regulator n=1 Tax=Mycobacterium sp. AT1 TaxID=1961706 RepID=UPI003514AD3B
MPRTPATPPPRQGRGAETRARIVRAAADLIHAKGVGATSLEEILAASAAGKSQFYQHFSSKDDLVQDVIALRAEQILGRQTLRLKKLDSFKGLQQWRNAIVQNNALRRGAWGCELGSLAAELSDIDETSRVALAKHFEEWEQLLAEAFARMRDRGVLRDDVDTQLLALGVMAALQGGYLLAQTVHNSRPMEVALDMAIKHVRTFEKQQP